MNDLVARLDGIFLGLLGCRLQFVPVDQITEQEWNDEDLARLKQDAEGAGSAGASTTKQFIHDKSQNRIAFPVRQSGTFAGLAVVNDWKTAEKPRLLELAEFMTALMSHELERDGDRQQTLRRTEVEMELQRENTNVIRLRPFARNQVVRLDTAFYSPTPAQVPSLLLQHADGFPLQRVAFETHSRTARWAFISLTDLPIDIFDSVENFKSIGAVTLFIEDLTTLSLERQQNLRDYMATIESNEIPLIIAGVSENPEHLIAAGVLDDGLCRRLVYNHLPWNPQDKISITVRKCVHLLVDGKKWPPTTHFVPYHSNYHDPEKPPVH